MTATQLSWNITHPTQGDGQEPTMCEFIQKLSADVLNELYRDDTGGEILRAHKCSTSCHQKVRDALGTTRAHKVVSRDIKTQAKIAAYQLACIQYSAAQ